ncbi:MAG: hypothetical protein K9N49_10985, partial [Candidatus Marinimicrobia bacterium]|nr:hypothetical protein [Candidatus Neomarinimicrobiota bacterium]
MKSNASGLSKIGLALLSAGALTDAALVRAEAPPASWATLGAFRPSPALTLYVVNDAEETAGRLAIRRGPRNEGDRLMVRVFDADEKLAFRQYVEAGQLKDTLGPGMGEVWGIPIAIPDTLIAANDLMADMTLSLRGKGIHQIRVTAGQINSAVEVALDRPCDYGVSFQNGTYYPWDETVTTAYVFVPTGGAALTLRGAGVTVEDGAGSTVFPRPGGAGPRTIGQIP